ncbi:MAG: methylenetetrahydrofolate reductase [NAD(P)H] [Candidatus Omnitrophica bacterium]|nr:methylenetetrahydrofolate reductase [NAD(P)H] [Candidatus Omnitrophota bacterium]
MKKIPDIFKEKAQTLSFEFFPPKTEQGFTNLKETVKELAELKPDFISCTYGAGGGNRDKTLDIAQMIQDQHHIPALAHLTCVLNTREQIRQIVEDIKKRGICNILALRGDPPQDQPNWEPGPENFYFAKDLCYFIRDNWDEYFGIGVAGFPEGHPRCPDLDLDASYLKRKILAGADFVITQLFLDNQDYFAYLKRLKSVRTTARVLPGILPITNYESLIKFCAKDKIRVPEKVKNIFEPIKNNAEATLKAGIQFAVEQCQELLNQGAPGIHLYTLNKVHPAKEIVEQLKFTS